MKATYLILFSGFILYLFYPGLVLASDSSSIATLSASKYTDSTGFTGHLISWIDETNKMREAFLVDNEKKDPYGFYGGYLRRFSYTYQGKVKKCLGSSRVHPGFGYTVNHYKSPGGSGGDSVSSRMYPGRSNTIFHGKHHYIQEFYWQIPIRGKKINTRVQWFFADGLSHPIFRISYDMRHLKANSILADSRSPYGDLQYDGGEGGFVEQIGWGDAWKFETLGKAPITKKTRWTYDRPNVVPYSFSRSFSSEAEMGLVATQDWRSQDAGGYWFYNYWGKTWKDKLNDLSGKKCQGSYCDWVMPEDWNWAYQIHNYQFQQDPRSKRLAWGTNFGFLGQEKYPRMGDDEKKPTENGYPEQSYSVAIVIGGLKDQLIEKQIKRIEANKKAIWTLTHGTLKAKALYSIQGNKKVSLQPLGYNTSFGTWDGSVGPQKVFQARLSQKSLQIVNPIFTLGGFSQSSRLSVSINKKPTLAYISWDNNKKRSWITIMSVIQPGDVVSISN